jgi:hypothetical protein
MCQAVRSFAPRRTRLPQRRRSSHAQRNTIVCHDVCRGQRPETALLILECRCGVLHSALGPPDQHLLSRARVKFFTGRLKMPAINITISNKTSDDQNVHVYDLFASGRRQVNGSPFPLAVDETSPQFSVNANAERIGEIEYACDGGPSLSAIEVTDQQNYEIR